MRSLHRTGVVLAGALVLIACIRFEFNAQTWRVVVPGLSAGMVALGIVAALLLLRLDRVVRRLCVSHRISPREIPCWYFLLVPIGAAAVAVKGHWHGQPITDLFGNPANRWDLVWSDPTLDLAFLAALVFVVLLYRLFQLLGAVANAQPAAAV